MTDQLDDPPLIVFDGECVLCSTSAQFVMRHDRRRVFRLTTSQSAAGQAAYARCGAEADATMLLVEGPRIRTQSDAALAIAARLDWPWRALAIMRIVPRAIRDPLYRWVARNRIHWFGRRDTCWYPTPDLTDRVL